MDEFLHLLTDLPHWGFEVVTDAVLGGLVYGLIWPRVRQHVHRDVVHGEKHAADRRGLMKDMGDVHG